MPPGRQALVKAAADKAVEDREVRALLQDLAQVRVVCML